VKIWHEYCAAAGLRCNCVFSFNVTPSLLEMFHCILLLCFILKHVVVINVSCEKIKNAGTVGRLYKGPGLLQNYFHNEIVKVEKVNPIG